MILVVHSLDESTDFLSVIPQFLERQKIEGYEYYLIKQPVENYELIANRILNHQGLVIFLGHGASHCIYLPSIANEPKTPLINRDNFHMLENKNFISLSCRSVDFIGHNYKSFNSTMIGFDDLPTHWEDVLAQREIDAHAYSGITDDVLENFRFLLANIFIDALSDTLLVEQSNFSFFYYRLRLYINRKIAEVCLNKISDNHYILANILFELKNGLKIYGNSNYRFI